MSQAFRGASSTEIQGPMEMALTMHSSDLPEVLHQKLSFYLHYSRLIQLQILIYGLIFTTNLEVAVDIISSWSVKTIEGCVVVLAASFNAFRDFPKVHVLQPTRSSR